MFTCILGDMVGSTIDVKLCATDTSCGATIDTIEIDFLIEPFV